MNNFYYKFLGFLLISFILSGCATSYQPNGFTGGYSETKLADDMYNITFQGNGYASKERVYDFALLRASDITLENSYKFFSILSQEKETSTDYVNIQNYNTYTKTSYGSTVAIDKPSANITIHLLKDKLLDKISYEAIFVQSSIKKKYNIDQNTTK